MQCTKMYITSKTLKKVHINELKEIEKNIGFALPESYKNFLETFGEGVYAGTIVVNMYGCQTFFWI